MAITKIPRYANSGVSFAAREVYSKNGGIVACRAANADGPPLKVKQLPSTTTPGEKKEAIDKRVEQKQSEIIQFISYLFSEDDPEMEDFHVSPEQVYQSVVSICRLGKEYRRALWNKISRHLKHEIHRLGNAMIEDAKKMKKEEFPLSESQGSTFVTVLLGQIKILQRVIAHLTIELRFLDAMFLQKYRRQKNIAKTIETEYAAYLEQDAVKKVLILSVRELLFSILSKNEGFLEVYKDLLATLSRISVPTYLAVTRGDASAISCEPEIVDWILTNRTESRKYAFRIEDMLNTIRHNRASDLSKDDVTRFDMKTLSNVLAKWDDRLLADIVANLSNRDNITIPLLTTTFNLYVDTTYFASFLDTIKSSVQDQLKEAILNKDSKEKLVTNLFEFREVLDEFVEREEKRQNGVSDKVKELRTAINSSWKAVAGTPETEEQISEALELYVDKSLRDKNLVETDLDDRLKRAIRVFRHLDNKQLFGKFYHRDFSRRLLQNRACHFDFERQFIELLKGEIGQKETEQYEKMLNDISQSQELTQKFATTNTIVPSGASKPLSFDVKVLTEKQWPSIKETEINMPPELLDIQTRFENFYIGEHKSRKMSWVPSRSTCTIRAQFDSGTKELTVNLFQAVVILQFNNTEKEELTYGEIQTLTGITAQELNPALMALVHSKTPVLLRSGGEGSSFSASDKFSVNTGLKDKSYKLNLAAYSKPRTAVAIQAERRQMKEEIRLDRIHSIQAAIVRVLKAKSQLQHAVLFEEVASQITTRFGPVPNDVFKKALEETINNNFVERDANDSNVYQYIA